MKNLEDISYFKDAAEFKKYEQTLKDKLPLNNDELNKLEPISFIYSMKKHKHNLKNTWFSIPKAILRDLTKGYSNSGLGAKYCKIEDIQISEFGEIRIKNKGEDNYFITEMDNDYKPGYLRVKYYPGLGYVYQLAAYALLEQPHLKCKLHVHHINNNGYENTKANLIYLRECEHAKIHPYMKCCKNCNYYQEIN